MHSPIGSIQRNSCLVDGPCPVDALTVETSELRLHDGEPHNPHHSHHILVEELESMSKDDLLAKYLLLHKHHKRLREECRHIRNELQVRISSNPDSAPKDRENRHSIHSKIPERRMRQHDSHRTPRNPTFSDPPIFEHLPETSEFYTISAQTAAKDREALSASPILIQGLQLSQNEPVDVSRAASTSPLSVSASSKDYIRRINQLNLKIFSMERDLEFERLQWHEEKTQLCEEIYTLRQNAAFYQEKIASMAREREALTMQAEASSEASFNQSKKLFGIANPYSARFFQKADPETRQRSVSTSVSNPTTPVNPIHKFEQLKRSFTDSIRLSPPVKTDGNSVFMPSSSIRSHSPIGESADSKIAHRQRFAHSMVIERPSFPVKILPWNSLSSSRPSEQELAVAHSHMLLKENTTHVVPVLKEPKPTENHDKFPEHEPVEPKKISAPRLTRSVTSRKNRQSLCAPSSFLSNS